MDPPPLLLLRAGDVTGYVRSEVRWPSYFTRLTPNFRRRSARPAATMQSVFAKNGSETPEPVAAKVSGECATGTGVLKSR